MPAADETNSRAVTKGGRSPLAADSSSCVSRSNVSLVLFLSSFLALYFELVIIRFLSTEIRIFAYFKNLLLISSFLGLGVGMALSTPPKVLKRLFPLIAAALFLLTAFASHMHLTHVPAPGEDYFLFGQNEVVAPLLGAFRYTSVMLLLIALVVAFCAVLGGIVGENLARLPSLSGYSINLAGSLAGIAVFTLLSYWGTPPAIWVLLGFLVGLPFVYHEVRAVLAFAFVIMAIAATQGGTRWSPYYRITLESLPPPAGWPPHPSVYLLTVNHDAHQLFLDLSPDFVRRYPAAEPYRSALATYDLPYRLIATPEEVLVVGAGTGNDVASALRHGAAHVDAVEIDPVILDLGRQLHPERPYDSPRVSLYVDDARAFFHKTKKKYDLIVFGFLDSLTLLSSYSSVRLDNYVYTLESFREAKGLLREGGTLALSFATFRPFLTERLFATLTQAFGGISPRCYRLNSVCRIFIEGAGRNAISLPEFKDISPELRLKADNVSIATDHWPFLYLVRPAIPNAMLWVLFPFLLGTGILLQKTIGLPSLASREAAHFFLLGAGFLLLESKGVTELSLLFGSTWIVNAVVIGAFLVMALLANTYVMFRSASRKLAYAMLFVLLILGMMFPYARLDAFPSAGRVLGAALLVGLPIFFTGLIFSRSFRDVRKPAQALGVNLLGAVIGGTLENAVMLAGTSVLGVLAILLYGLSALCLKGQTFE